MIRDLHEGAPSHPSRADVCIVGGGAAGIVLALELVSLGKSVTLLEGGGRLVEAKSQLPYMSSLAALPHRGLHEGRIRALGGTTNLWGGQILELDPMDFEKRPWIPESGWPFPKTTLARFYTRALELEGISESIQDDANVWSEVGVDLPHYAGFSAYMSRWCPEPKFARLHRQVLEADNSLNLWIHANAIELLTSDDRVTGIRCKTDTGIENIFMAQTYCFCLGAIESSRFFLQPRAGSLPWNSSGMLGRHFQDHIDCDAAIVLPHSLKAFHAIWDAIYLRGYKYNPKLKLDEEAQRQRNLLHAGATFYSAGKIDDAALSCIKSTAKLLLSGRPSEVRSADIWQLGRNAPMLARQTYRYAVRHRAYHPRGAELRMRVHCEQEPTTASAITLSPERDHLGMLRTCLSWKISSLELRTIREFVQLAKKSLAPLADIDPHPALEADDAKFIRLCQDSFHHMGGMRMSTSAQRGVVDENLRLHGIRNAYVCSSAVFPSSGFSNPTHTLLALAVRLAEYLAR